MSTAEKYSSEIDFLFTQDGVFSSSLEQTQHLFCECIYLRTLRTNVKSQESPLKVCRGKLLSFVSLYCQHRKWRRRIDPSSVWNSCRTQKPASLCHTTVEGFIINAHFPPLSNTVNRPDYIPVKHFLSEEKQKIKVKTTNQHDHKK